MTPAAPLIVTLPLDADTLALADALRRQHFPPTRNHLSAHVTLFHNLPGHHEPEIAALLTATCDPIAPLPLALTTPRFLGRGVAIDVRCDGLLPLRAALAAAWAPWLTPQDRQPFRPHITVQNKVAPELARALFERLRAAWVPRSGHAVGLGLHRYRGGPWEPAGTFPFRGVAPFLGGRVQAASAADFDSQ